MQRSHRAHAGIPEPVERGVQPHHFADNDDGASMRAASALAAASRQRRHDDTLRGVVALLMIATGSSAGRPAAISRAAIRPRCVMPIYSTMTGEPRRDRVPIDRLGAHALAVVPVTKSRPMRFAMRQRDAGIGKTADPAVIPGTMRNGIGRGQCQRLLAAAAEHTGVAPLSRSTRAPLPRQHDQPGRDVGLARRRPAAPFAGIFERGPRPCEIENTGIDQSVVNNESA